MKGPTKIERIRSRTKRAKVVKETCYKQKAMHDMMHEPMILSIGSIDAWT